MAEPYPGIEALEIISEAHNYNSWLADWVVREAGRRDPIVDFGAGSGTFARILRDRGHHVLCVEPDATLAGRLRSNGFEVHTTSDEIRNAAVPVVYSLNVLEHIDDDISALKGLRRILTENGRLILFVPAFQILFSSFDKRYGHHRRYRREDLNRRVESAGFRVLSCRYGDSLGFLAALSFKLLDSGSGEIRLPAVRLYDNLAFPLSRRLDAIFGHWFGKNVLLVAEKR